MGQRSGLRYQYPRFLTHSQACPWPPSRPDRPDRLLKGLRHGNRWQRNRWPPPVHRDGGTTINRETYPGYGDDTVPPLPDVTVAQLFEQQARQTPDAVAVEWAGGTITYARLHARTDRLARRLTRHGVQPGDRVAVLMHHSPELVVTLLAVAKCGAAYVPLDHRYPASRMRSILGG